MALEHPAEQRPAPDRDGDTNYDDENVSLSYDAVGNLTDDGENYEYVYDVWGRLRFVVARGTSDVVAEYTYNGLGHRIGWHYDVDADGTVEANTEQNSDDPWFHFVYDDRWRIVAVYRVLHWKDGGGWTFDADPKERFVYHNAGLDGYGGSSYIDAVILRDRDANTAWADEADGTLEERVYYCQNFYEAGLVKCEFEAGEGLSTLLSEVSGRGSGLPGLNQLCGNAHSGERSSRRKF